MASIKSFRPQRFGASPVYVCRVCKHRTRAVDGDEEGVQLCSPCFTLAGLENSLSDNGPSEFTAADKAEVQQLIALLIKRDGRDAADWGTTFKGAL